MKFLLNIVGFQKLFLPLRHEIKTNFVVLQIYLIDFSIMVISDYYHQVLKSRKERIAFRAEVMNRLGISYPAFYYKLSKDSFRKAEREVINTIIKEMQNA